jgi:glycine oxidase
VSHSDSFDAVVAGGGIIGCSIAWRLVRRGLSVAVVEPGTPGREATWAAAGMLSPLGEARRPGPFLRLALASFESYPTFVRDIEEQTGIRVDLRTEGCLHVARDDASLRRLEAQVDWQRAAGFDVAWLTGDDARRLEPRLAPDVLAALRIDHDHSVDNRALGRALWSAAAAAGCRFILGRSARRLLVDGGRVQGVELDHGEHVAAGRVVLAAGAWSAGLLGLPRALSVFPVRGQMAAVEAVPPLVKRVILSDHCYLVPRSAGRVLIGATLERAEFHRHVTAGAVATLLAAGVAAVPDLAAAPFLEAWCGFRPGTPDDLPILGADAEVQGLLYATGHFRNGILLAPITAAAITALAMGEEPPVDLAAFDVGRFPGGGAGSAES